MSEDAPLQNRLGEGSRERRASVEFERMQFRSGLLGRQYGSREVQMSCKTEGIECEGVFRGREVCRRKLLAALRLASVAVLSGSIVTRTTFV